MCVLSLASHILGRMIKTPVQNWQEICNHPIYYLFTLLPFAVGRHFICRSIEMM